jgi:hypothetical protein
MTNRVLIASALAAAVASSVHARTKVDKLYGCQSPTLAEDPGI